MSAELVKRLRAWDAKAYMAGHGDNAEDLMILAADALEAQRAEVGATQRIKQLEDALRLCDRYCEHLDHAPGSRFHASGTPCPVEKIVNDALDGPSVP